MLLSLLLAPKLSAIAGRSSRRQFVQRGTAVLADVTYADVRLTRTVTQGVAVVNGGLGSLLVTTGLWVGALLLCLPLAQAAAQQLTLRGTAAPASTDTAPLAFTDVTVVDVTTGKLLPHQTVLIEKNRIRAVGKKGGVRPPPGARVVDARGKYLIPGLWNMHAHLGDHGPARNAMRYKDFIASGLTDAREMAQRFPHGADSLRVWQREIMAGTRVGPRIVGPSADLGFQTGLRPQDVPPVMDSLKAAGMVFIKFHNDDESRETYFAIAREARRIGVPLVGHRAHDVTEVELSDSGQRSLEHINEVHLQCWSTPNAVPLPPACAAMAEHFIRNGTWFVPTLVRFDPFNDLESHKRGCRPDSLRADHPLDAEHSRGLQEFVQAVHAVGRMHRAGIAMLAGTDGGTGADVIGCALHVELAFLVDAGFTPLEALQTATLNPAKFFNATDSLGTVAPGKLADLDLLDANPLADIHNTKKIWGVVVNGLYFDRTALDTLVAQITDNVPSIDYLPP